MMAWLMLQMTARALRAPTTWEAMVEIQAMETTKPAPERRERKRAGRCVAVVVRRKGMRRMVEARRQHRVGRMSWVRTSQRFQWPGPFAVGELGAATETSLR
jgi:hypothetical protein